MMAGILQPGYLPWLGFFEQVHRSDIFVIYDDVQYDKDGWRNRNRIKTANGVQWLTVPVSISLTDAQLIKDVRIDNRGNWRKKHLQSIKQSYSKSRFFKDCIGIFEDGYSMDWECLVDLDMFFVERLLDCLGMKDKKVVRSSTLSPGGKGMERLVAILHELGADEFYEGAAGRNYINDDYFLSNGIRLEYQDYHHPVYPQMHGEFVPYLSVIDLLFNCGSESLGILTNKHASEDTLK